MNLNDYLEKMSLALNRDNNIVNMEKENKNVSELQLTFEYLYSLKEKYKSEIRIFILLAIFVLSYVLVRELSTLVIVCYFISLLLDPFLVKLEKMGVARGKGLILLFSSLLIVLVTSLSILIPRLVVETIELIEAVPFYAEGSFKKVKDFLEDDFKIVIPGSAEEVKHYFSSFTEGKSFNSLKPILEPLSKTLFAGYSATLTLINLMLLPFIVFYLSRDWRALNRQLVKAIPSSYSDKVVPFFIEVKNIIVAYARGQAMVSIFLIFAYSLALLLAGVKYALPLGFFAGLLSVAPYLGFFTGFSLAFIVQIVNEGTIESVVKLVIAFSIIQFIESNFVTPKILGESTGLHPLIVILALVVGGTLFGFVGLLLGIPAAAIIKIVMKRALQPV